MQHRPELSKVVFSWPADDSLIDAVREAVPNAEVVLSSEDNLADDIVGAQALFGGPLSDGALEHADSLVWQHAPFAGVERVISPGLVERNIILTNSRGVSAPNMAEHAIAMMLAFGRALPTFVRQQDARIWKWKGESPSFFELTGQTVILLGTGAIGRETAKRLRPFGCTLIGARRRPEPLDEFDQVVGFDDLDKALPEADHIVSSLPLTTRTARIVSAGMISQMKRGAYFYNVGRGGTVDQDALIEALQSGHLAGAGLDVTDPEPLPEESPLWGMQNVLITSHTSGGSPMVTSRVAQLLVENIRRYQAGEDLLNEVDLEMGY